LSATLLNEIEAAVFDILACASETENDTATGYDQAVAVADLQNYPAPLSLRPNEAVMMACLHGRSFNGRCRNPLASGWGDHTATAAEAEAVRDSWQFRTSRATRVVTVDQLEHKGWFIGSGGSRGSTTDRNARTCAKRVSEQDLDAAYSEFLKDKKTDFDVLEVAQRFIARLAKGSYVAMYARETGQEEDLASEFLPLALDKIRAKSCKGPSFAKYISSAFWFFATNHFHSSKKEAAHTESYSGTGFEDENGQFTVPVIDNYSVALWESDSPAPKRPYRMEHWPQKWQRIAQMCLNSEKKVAIAAGLKLSRHQVDRALAQMQKDLNKQLKASN